MKDFQSEYQQDSYQDQLETAIIELVGGHTPRHGLEQEDQRDAPDEETVMYAMGDMLDIIEGVLTDTVNEEDIIDIFSGFTTALQFILYRLEKKQDDVQSEIRIQMRESKGDEISDVHLQQQTNLMMQTDNRIAGIEHMRDICSEYLLARYAHHWHPPRGSHVSERNKLTYAVIEARDLIKARADRKLEALTPQGTMVGFAGGKEYNDHHLIYRVLDKARERYPDMVLVHGGTRTGAERLAACWAESRRVSQVVCSPDWKVHGKAAPFKRNDEMLKLKLQGLIACPGNGITENLIDKARQKGLTVKILS